MWLLKPVCCFLILLCGIFPSGRVARGGRLREIEEEVSREERRRGGYFPFYGSSDSTPRFSSGDYFPSDSAAYFTFGTPPAGSGYRTLLDYYQGAAGLNPFYNISSSLSYFYDVQGDLDGFGFAGRARTPIGTFDLDFTRFREETVRGNDYLNLFYLSYSISSYIEEKAILDLGLSYAGLRGDDYHDGGGIYVAGEILLFDPVLLDVSLRYSKVHGTGIGDYRAGLLLNIAWTTLRAGYRYIQIESAPDIRGPEASFGIRF